jgi:hypothetical protein
MKAGSQEKIPVFRFPYLPMVLTFCHGIVARAVAD